MAIGGSTNARSKRSSRACSSGSAAAAQPAAPAARRRRSEPPKAKANIPRGTNGVYADADQAAKAARKAFEQNERTPIATRVKMVENMRKAVLVEHRRAVALRRRRDRPRPLRGQAVEEPARRREDAGRRDPAARRVHRRRRPDADRARAVRRDARDHADDEPDRDDPLQRDRHGRGRQRGRVQRAPVGGADLQLVRPPAQRGDPGRGRSARRARVASSGRRSRARTR